MMSIRVLPALVAVAALSGGVAASGSAHGTAGPPVIQVSSSATAYVYSTKTLTVPAGKEFLLVYTNHSSKQHNVSLEVGELEYGATQTVAKGMASSIFTLKKGTYHFYSSVGNDENKGLSGTLIAR